MIKMVIAQKEGGAIVDFLDAGTGINGLASGLMYADVECDGDEANISEISGWDDARAAVVRAERDALLLACDWTQLPDSPLDTTPKANWATYRQDLRDVPELENFPNNFTWPTEPAS
jgi:hypothetical protein